MKQTLSKSKVNGRPIYGASQEDRARYASFTATTNNPHPLTDATGSRRYICLTIPEGQYIDNTGDINYDQLYAQVLHELREQKAPYWFNNDEVARIQQLNQDYMLKKDMTEMVEACFRKPSRDEYLTDAENYPKQVHLAGHRPQRTRTSWLCDEGSGLRLQRTSPRSSLLRCPAIEDSLTRGSVREVLGKC